MAVCGDQDGIVENPIVAGDLLVESVQRILIAFNLITYHSAIDHRDIGTLPPMVDTQLINDQGISILVRFSKLFEMESSSDGRIVQHGFTLDAFTPSNIHVQAHPPYRGQLGHDVMPQSRHRRAHASHRLYRRLDNRCLTKVLFRHARLRLLPFDDVDDFFGDVNSVALPAGGFVKYAFFHQLADVQLSRPGSDLHMFGYGRIRKGGIIE
jgi:hypothetical protein